MQVTHTDRIHTPTKYKSGRYTEVTQLLVYIQVTHIPLDTNHARTDRSDTPVYQNWLLLLSAASHAPTLTTEVTHLSRSSPPGVPQTIQKRTEEIKE